MRRLGSFATALLLDLVGAVGALLIALQTWQTITTPRPEPFHADVLHASGRTVSSAPFALALVALAGVVAVLATRGVWRRVVGLVLAVDGALLVWQAIVAAAPVGTVRARSIVAAVHEAVGEGSAPPRVSTHVVWPALTVVCGVLIVLAGVLAAWRGHRWQAMSARYESDSGAREATRNAAGLWSALDRGEDPTR